MPKGVLMQNLLNLCIQYVQTLFNNFAENKMEICCAKLIGLYDASEILQPFEF